MVKHATFQPDKSPEKECGAELNWHRAWPSNSPEGVRKSSERSHLTPGPEVPHPCLKPFGSL